MAKPKKIFLPLSGRGVPEIVSLDSLPGADGAGNFALLFNDPGSRPCPLVRVHSECVTGDVLGSLRCDCGAQLAEALDRLSIEGGILIYLRQEGRGIGLQEKLKAYALQDEGWDTFEANFKLGHSEDARSYDLAAAFLAAQGVRRIQLITRNPDKVYQLEQFGISVERIIPTKLYVNVHNERYLQAKEHRADLLKETLPD